MMKRTLSILALVAVSQQAAWAEFPNEVTIRDVTIKCCTVAEVRVLGLDCEDIPWQENAARLWIEAINAYHPAFQLERPMEKVRKDFVLGDKAAEIRAHLGENARAFDLLKQADGMARCVFPVEKTEMAMESRILYAGPATRLARELCCRAVIKSIDGDAAGAIDDCFLVMRLGRQFGAHGAFSIVWLLGMAIEGRAVGVLDEMLASGSLDQKTLETLSTRLAAMRVLPVDAKALARLERADAPMTAADYEKDPEKILDLFANFSIGAPEPDPGGKNKARVKKELRVDPKEFRRIMMSVADFCDRQAEKPLHEALKPENTIEAFKEKEGANWPWITRWFTPNFTPLLASLGKEQVFFDALVIRCTIERHKLAKGAWPKELAELVPAYLDKVPLDPFSGKPYRYRIEEGGQYRLWSVGEDLKDDDGRSDGRVVPDIVFTGGKGRNP
jgi:hypothetical protein